MLRDEDVALLADGATELPRDTVRRLQQWVLADAMFSEALTELEALAEAAEIPQDLAERRIAALEIRSDLDRLRAAGGAWQDPLEVLDPDDTRGIDLQGLVAMARRDVDRAETKDEQRASIAVWAKLWAKLDRTLAAERIDAEWVRQVLEALRDREPQRVRRIRRALLRGFEEFETATEARKGDRG